MDLIRDELQRQQIEWNTHYIYARKGQVRGKPDKMFYLPQEFDTVDYGRQYNEQEVLPVIVQLEEEDGDPVDVDEDFVKLVYLLVPDWKEPTTAYEGLKLYVEVTRRIANIQ